MASASRCLRAMRPAALPRLARPAVRSNWPGSLRFRAFSTCTIREARKYTSYHEWIDLNADKTAGVVGISNYAAEELGDVVYVELPDKGKTFTKGDNLGTVESVKSAADIGAPVACKITDVNLLLEEKPGTINKVPEDDSEGGGWVCKVQVDEQGLKDFEDLMEIDEYNKYIAKKESE